MAIVDLGTFEINIGAASTQYQEFDFRDSRAYIINCQSTIQIPQNIFSFFRFRTIITNSFYNGSYGHHIIDKPLTTREFAFLIPFSNLYNGNGTVTIEVERLPFTSSGNDASGTVTLNLSYDDDNSVRTWL